MTGIAPASIELPDPEFGPEERYRIYEKGAARKPTLVATCGSAAAVGVALVQMAEDRWEDESQRWAAPIVGVLDGKRGRWVTSCWSGGGLL